MKNYFQHFKKQRIPNTNKEFIALFPVLPLMDSIQFFFSNLVNTDLRTTNEIRKVIF